MNQCNEKKNNVSLLGNIAQINEQLAYTTIQSHYSILYVIKIDQQPNEELLIVLHKYTSGVSGALHAKSFHLQKAKNFVTSKTL